MTFYHNDIMGTSDKRAMGFLDHLEELRWRLARTLIGIILFSAVSYFYIDEILYFFLEPAKKTKSSIVLQSLQVQSMFMIKWYVSLISGFVLSVPHTVYQLWKFVAPGLKVNEKKIIIPVVVLASLSFGIGIIFGYVVIVPFSLEFFSSIASQQVENNFSIQYYFSFMAWLMIGAGLIFQLPVVSLLLSAIGVLTPAFMRHYRKYSIIVILVLSSFITPPDPVSMLLMAFPLVILYETSIGVSWLVNRSKHN